MFPEALTFFVFTDYIEEGRLYDMLVMHGNIFLGPRITKSNCPYVARHSNNIKLRIASQVKLDSIINNQIYLDWILSKIQAFAKISTPLIISTLQFTCHLCIFEVLCEHKCNNSTFVTISNHFIISVYSKHKQTSKMELFAKIINVLTIFAKSYLLDI